MVEIWSIISVGIMISCLIYPLIRISSASLAIAIGLITIFMIELLTMRSGSVIFSPIFQDLALYTVDLKSGTGLYTIFTSMFLHLTFWHIVFNALALVFLGMFLEEQIGTTRLLVIYVVSGLVGSVVFALTNLNSVAAAVGASGAISGLLGAIVVLYPNQPFRFLMFPFMDLPAWLITVVFLALQLMFAFSENFIAWEAHIGGLVAGMVLAPVIMRASLEERADRGEKVDIMIFASTPEQREIANKIKSESIGDIRKAWLEQLVETAKCPVCRSRLRVYRGRLKCRNGHKFNV